MPAWPDGARPHRQRGPAPLRGGRRGPARPLAPRLSRDPADVAALIRAFDAVGTPLQRGGPRRIPSRVPAGRIKAPTLLIWGSTTSPSVSSSPMAWTCLREQAAHRVRARYGPLGDGGTARGSELAAAAELPRLASGPVTRDAERVFQREAPEVERAADDHAAQSAMPELRERRDVLQRADAA